MFSSLWPLHSLMNTDHLELSGHWLCFVASVGAGGTCHFEDGNSHGSNRHGTSRMDGHQDLRAR